MVVVSFAGIGKQGIDMDPILKLPSDRCFGCYVRSIVSVRLVARSRCEKKGIIFCPHEVFLRESKTAFDDRKRP